MTTRYKKSSNGGWESTPSSRNLTTTENNKGDKNSCEQRRRSRRGSLWGRVTTGVHNAMRRSSNEAASMSSDNPQFGMATTQVDGKSAPEMVVQVDREKEDNRFLLEQKNLATVIQNSVAGNRNVKDQRDEWEREIDVYVETVQGIPRPEEVPPLDGVRLSVLQTLLKVISNLKPPKCVLDHQHSRDCHEWTNGAVYLFMKKFTNSRKCSVVNMLRSYDSGFVHPLLGSNSQDVSQLATVFVSHTWSTAFPAFVESLERHVSDTRNSLTPDTAYFWIDGFTINQHAPPASSNFARAFLNGVEVIEEVVCVLGSWRNPVPLTRVWCLWEIMGAIQHNKPFSILLTNAEEKDVVKALLDNFESIIASLCQVDAQNANATVAADKEMILKEVRKLPKGVLGVNHMVLEPLRAWIAETCETELCVLRETTPEADVTFRLMNNLAAFYESQGRYNEAEPLYIETLASRQRVLGDKHPDTLTSMNNLASLYFSQKRTGEAEELYLKALEYMRNELGEENTDTLSTMNNLALLFEKQGRYTEAEGMYARALELKSQVLGVDHPNTMSTMNNIAGLYESQARYDEADKLYAEVLQRSKRVLGDEHPDTLSLMHNLAGLYHSQGRYSEAETLFVDVIRIRNRVLGEEHPNTLISKNNLAMLYEALGRYTEAEKLFAANLTSRKQVLGDTHPDTLTSMYNLAALYFAQGQYTESEELYSKQLELCHQVHGDSHPCTFTTMNSLGALMYSLHRFDEAQTLFETAVKSMKHVLGKEHPDTLTCMSNIAELYLSQGKPEDAVQVLEELVAGMKQFYGDESRETKQTMTKLLQIYLQLGRRSDAERLCT